MVASYFRVMGLGLLHIFYPSLCEGCGKPLVGNESVLCIGCKLLLPITNYHDHAGNDTGIRFAGRVPYQFATTYAYFTNDGLLQHLLHGLKYGKKQEIGRFLGRELGYGLQQTAWASQLDVIVPVPLHPKKETERGYNQSMLIAQGLASVLNIPANGQVLKRTRHTQSQTKKNRADRLKNMQGAFAITNPNTLKHKHILLVDDVLTTGATLESCANELLDVEGVRVSIATIGIAV